MHGVAKHIAFAAALLGLLATAQAQSFPAGKVTADAGTGVKTAKNGDLWLVDVNDYEHYRIPDAVISGG